jgi:hypothetical protein
MSESEIDQIRKELSGSSISLREQNPECLAKGHYCATSVSDGLICLKRATPETAKQCSGLIEPAFEATLCSKNPEKGKPIVVDERLYPKPEKMYDFEELIIENE